MKKIKFTKIIMSFLLIATMLLAVSCDNDTEYITERENLNEVNASTDKVTIYTYVNSDKDNQIYNNDTKFYYPLLEMAHMYNNYCSGNKMGDKAVRVVKFESRDRMIQQMSTEIMAGGGPDIILLDNELPISRLINQGAFEDLNPYIEKDTSENALDINKYNKSLMDTGVFKGKRYMMPMLIEPDVYITNTGVLSKYGIKENKQITYDNLDKALNEYLNSDDETTFTESYETSKEIILSYINDNIDKETFKTSFNNEKFKDTLEKLKELCIKSTKDTSYSNNLENSLFTKGSFDQNSGVYTPYIYSISNMGSLCREAIEDFSSIPPETMEEYIQEYYIENNGYDPDLSQKENEKNFRDFVWEKEGNRAEIEANASATVFINSISKDKDTLKGIVNCGFMINANSRRKENAYDFIKYSMGERMQRYISYDGCNYSVPVNNEALKNSYTDMGYQESRVTSLKKDSSIMERYINHILNLNTFVVRDGYYNDNVIGSIVDDYLQGSISLDNFITNLESKTKIYLYE